jgi:hypothetical protein
MRFDPSALRPKAVSISKLEGIMIDDDKIAKIKAQIEIDRLRREAAARNYWNNLPKFEKPEDVPQIPRVEHKEYVEFYVPKLIAAGAIQKADLIDGAFYLGDHRRGRIAKWNAEKNRFEYWRNKFSAVYIDTCNHFEDDDGFALFVPILQVTQDEFDQTK